LGNNIFHLTTQKKDLKDVKSFYISIELLQQAFAAESISQMFFKGNSASTYVKVLRFYWQLLPTITYHNFAHHYRGEFRQGSQWLRHTPSFDQCSFDLRIGTDLPDILQNVYTQKSWIVKK